MMTLFKEQKVAMIINGPWEVADISDDPNFGGIENLGIAPVPAGSAGQGAPVGGHNYVIWTRAWTRPRPRPPSRSCSS